MKMSNNLHAAHLSFFKHDVTPQVIYQSEHTFSIVNLKPITPHHILVIPKRHCKQLYELNSTEVTDFYNSVHLLYRFIRHLTDANGVNLAIQDGELSGQSVPHVHAHIIPRYENGNMGDGIYALLKGEFIKKNKKDGVLKPDAPVERRERSMKEMTLEADYLKEQLEKWMELSEEDKDKQFKEIPDFSEKDTEL